MSAANIVSRLTDGDRLLLDGANGTELKRRGVTRFVNPDGSVREGITRHSANAIMDAPNEVRQILSANEQAVLAEVVIATKNGSASDNVQAIVDAVREADNSTGDFEIGIAGNESLTQEIDEIVERDFATIMLVTLVLGLGILLIAFRAVVAAVIPLTLALAAIFSATAVAAVVSHAVPLADSYSEMILLMGMAVGIDYSLFIVSRFRSERKAGRPKLEAIAVARQHDGSGGPVRRHHRGTVPERTDAD